MVDRDITSAFNEGIFQIQRLNYLWMQANEYGKQGRLVEWRWVLDTIWREINIDAIREESKGFDPTEIDKVYEENPWFKKYDALDQEVEGTKGRAHYKALERMHTFLKGLQDVSGKGTKTKDLSEDEIE